MAREKILLIDGHSILNRAFYGVPDLTTKEGLHTNGVYGFLNILFKILEEEKPDYLTCAFDVHAPTFRHKMFKDYKGTRSKMPEELREQVPVLKDVLRAMGVNLAEKEGYEADDVLGTLARQNEAAGLDVVILSGDRDILQLATEHTMIRIPKTKKGGTTIENYLACDVKASMGVTPTEFIDVKALMGDSSDNIPGVPGIGVKTATKLITDYGSILGCREHLSELKPPRAKKNLELYWEQAVMSKDLATIRTQVPVDFDCAKARMGNLYTEDAFKLYRKLEFTNLLSKFSNGDEKVKAEKVIDKESLEEISAPPDALCGLCLTKDGVAVALEEAVYYAPFCDAALKAFLEDRALFATYGLKEQLLLSEALPAEKAFDVKLAAYLINPLKSRPEAADIAAEYLNMPLDKTDLSEKDVAAFKARIALKSLPVLKAKLEDTKMMDLFSDIEMPLCACLAKMQKTGIRAEKATLNSISKKLSEKISAYEEEIFEEAGCTFNINSPKQLGSVLFETLCLPPGKKTKTGYSTAAGVLEKLAPDYPIVKKILDYRTVTKLKSTYADGLVPFIEADERIHGAFHQTVTATGRISSSDPNLQNIPVRIEMGREIRKVFVPQEGCVFLDADYSQIELRILAHCSGDENLIAAYKEARDIHRMTASKVFHTPYDEVTDTQRRNAKAVNFGIVYGISSFGLGQDLDISRKEAQMYIDSYFEMFPGVKRYLDGLVESASEKGYAETLYGRKRPMPELKAKNFMQRNFGERVAMNAPIQGTAADIMKIAMIRVDAALKAEHLRSRVVLQVHDELLLEVFKEELERVQVILQNAMEHAADLHVPLIADMHVGASWYEAK